MPSVLEDAFVLPGWRRQDRLRVRPQVRGHVAKVRRGMADLDGSVLLEQQTAAGGRGERFSGRSQNLIENNRFEGSSAVVLSC